MANVFFENPPVLTGDERTQLQQLSGYLYTISQKLNEALMDITLEQLNVETQEKIREAAGEQKETQKDEYNTLKSLIIKTAEIVRTEMDEISTHLEMETEALSEQFGDLQRSLQSDIRATAEGILQEYHYDELVQSADSNTSFRNRTSQYIFTGLISENPPEYGVAVGEGVTAYDSNGNPYLNDNAKCATFTMNKMSFWQGSVELAYFSGSKFYIMNGEITKTLQMGNHMWMIMADKSMALVTV